MCWCVNENTSFLLCLWIPYEVRDYGAQGVWFIGLKWFICYDHWQVTKVPTGGEKFKLNHCYENRIWLTTKKKGPKTTKQLEGGSS